jgi:hypothetical protein
MSEEFYRQQAQRARDLAAMADPFTRKACSTLQSGTMCGAEIRREHPG